MTCEETRDFLSPFADGELDLVRGLAIEQHLEQCPACASALKRTQGLSSALRDPALYFPLPPGLQARVRAGVRRVAQPRQRYAWRPILAASAAAVLVVAGSVVVRGLSSPTTTDDLLAREVVASHVRSLMLEKHRVDIPSSDQHQVKPWFIGKVDFAPEVKDLSGQGFPLIGGRLDYLDGRPAAALVYERSKHAINVFVWRTAEKDRAPEALERQGFHLIHWTDNSRAFWAVSDLNIQELHQFTQLLR